MHDPANELAQEWMVRGKAVEFRYPDALPVMFLDSAAAAVDTAERNHDFVAGRLR